VLPESGYSAVAGAFRVRSRCGSGAVGVRECLESGEVIVMRSRRRDGVLCDDTGDVLFVEALQVQGDGYE